MVCPQSVLTCRWAQATLLLPRPHWYEAAQNAWSCTIESTPKGLADTTECRTCSRWQPVERPESHASARTLLVLTGSGGARNSA
jgi:hypothetical protein